MKKEINKIFNTYNNIPVDSENQENEISNTTSQNTTSQNTTSQLPKEKLNLITTYASILAGESYIKLLNYSLASKNIHDDDNEFSDDDDEDNDFRDEGDEDDDFSNDGDEDDDFSNDGDEDDDFSNDGDEGDEFRNDEGNGFRNDEVDDAEYYSYEIGRAHV